MKAIALLLLLVAYGLLVPGLNQPMLSVQGTVEKTKLVELGRELLTESKTTPGLMRNLAEMVVDSIDVSGTVNAFDKTQSIVGTAQDLLSNGHVLVAVLIVLFSVIIPVAKGLMLLITLVLPPSLKRHRLMLVNNLVSKWSMADVFVIAIFIAFLAGNGLQENQGLVDFHATLENGFWFFLGYCLVSILATQLLAHAYQREDGQQENTIN